ncbi:VCBS repeat-containing protein [Actinomadura barringtoniae]|uniref:VCBS repeat-containing protein n=1 Tax=Actinomadura barringtoniae TaxID=1427535 RepID=A0A939PAW8_9ACTN|nr:VCBS repeat-containing protein [Actinomadura barringtoniae]MBO2446234.1 VCBS repeat-containing protein [Actinomadura barringtoniae]
MAIKHLPVIGAATGLAVALGTVAAVGATGDDTQKAAPASAPSAALGKAAKPGDFNGDGRPDTAGTTQPGNPGGPDKRPVGMINVVYTGAKGPSPVGRQVLTPAALGFRKPEAYSATAPLSADFDRDGYADLVVAARDVPKSKVVIVYGGPKGLTGRKVVLTTQTVGTQFEGDSMAVGDFNGNGRPDIAVLGSGHTFVTFMDPVKRAVRGVTTTVKAPNSKGLYQLQAADFNGDHRDDLVLVVAKDSGDGDDIPNWGELRLGSPKGLGPGKVYGKKGLGFTAATGDVNGDGKADLVNEDRPANVLTRKLAVRLGTKTGFGPVKTITLGRDLGGHMSLADVNGDGKADLATEVLSNAVAVLFGAKGGLTTKGMQALGRKTPGAPKGVFARGYVLADLDGDRLADLTAGGVPPGDSVGTLNFFRGTRSGITMRGVVTLNGKQLDLGAWQIQLGAGLMD